MNILSLEWLEELQPSGERTAPGKSNKAFGGCAGMLARVLDGGTAEIISQ